MLEIEKKENIRSITLIGVNSNRNRKERQHPRPILKEIKMKRKERNKKTNISLTKSECHKKYIRPG